MQGFDASSMIYAWDNYPVDQFPGLWDWLAREINEQRLVMSVVAFNEVSVGTSDCTSWLHDVGLRRLDVTNAVMQEAMRIKTLLGIVDDHYHAKGVGENDLLIIATARVAGHELVSNEGRQNVMPEIPSKRRIPSVCAMREVAVPCIDFIDYLRRSRMTFG